MGLLDLLRPRAKDDFHTGAFTRMPIPPGAVAAVYCMVCRGIGFQMPDGTIDIAVYPPMHGWCPNLGLGAS